MFDKYAISVCRIEPENNIHVILEAFAEGPMPLMVVGNWEYSVYGRDLRARYGKNPNLAMLGPIYDHEKLNELRRRCMFYVHGHSCGGTNPSLVEAMYLGLPIAAFDVNFNRETTENQALYFRDAAGLRQIAAGTDAAKLREVAAAMKAIAERRYTWSRIAELYAALL